MDTKKTADAQNPKFNTCWKPTNTKTVGTEPMRQMPQKEETRTRHHKTILTNTPSNR